MSDFSKMSDFALRETMAAVRQYVDETKRQRVALLRMQKSAECDLAAMRQEKRRRRQVRL